MLSEKVVTYFQMLFLGILLTQHALSSVVPDPAVNSEGNPAIKTKCKETLPKEHFEKYEELRNFTRSELNTFNNRTLSLLKIFFDKIIEDGTREASLNEKLEPFKKLKQQFTEKEKTNNTFETFDTEVEAHNLLEKYNATSIGQHTEEVDLIADILKKFGWQTLKNQTYEAGHELVKNFATKVEEYRNSLVPEERLNDKPFNDWYAKLNAEQDHCGKIKLFEEFSELYCSTNVKEL